MINSHIVLLLARSYLTSCAHVFSIVAAAPAAAAVAIVVVVVVIVMPT